MNAGLTPIYRFCYWKCGSVPDAQDLVGETKDKLAFQIQTEIDWFNNGKYRQG